MSGIIEAIVAIAAITKAQVTLEPSLKNWIEKIAIKAERSKMFML